MKLHANAPLGPKGRAIMVRRITDDGLTLAEAAEAAGVSVRTAGKWVRRYRAEGVGGLLDRSSAPRRVANRTEPSRVEAIAALRRLRLTASEIAELLEMASSTVSAVLKRIGLGRLSRLEPPEPIRRYERSRPGELIHIDVKKLGRIKDGAGHRVLGRKAGRHNPRRADGSGVRRQQVGWERVHIAIDDCTRLAYVEVLADEKATTAVGFLGRAVAFYRSHGVTVERLMTDNGSAYRSAVHSLACRRLGIKHLRTRPYRPQTNGKAERFIRTMLDESIYCGAVYGSSTERAAALSGWLERYNFRRRHGALGQRPPIERLRELTGNNVVGSYI